MWEFINYFEVKQLIETHPGEIFFAFVLLAVIFVAAIYGLATFRLFTVITEHHHHHHHYYPAREAQPDRPSVAAHAQVPMVGKRDKVIENLFEELFGWAANTGESVGTRPVVAQAQPASRKRSKMSRGKRFRILRRDGFRCKMCGRGPDDDDGLKLHVDHKMPVAKGGTDDEENLWTLCEDCNGAKSDTIMEELFADDIEAAGTDDSAKQASEQ